MAPSSTTRMPTRPAGRRPVRGRPHSRALGGSRPAQRRPPRRARSTDRRRLRRGRRGALDAVEAAGPPALLDLARDRGDAQATEVEAGSFSVWAGPDEPLGVAGVRAPREPPPPGGGRPPGIVHELVHEFGVVADELRAGWRVRPVDAPQASVSAPRSSRSGLEGRDQLPDANRLADVAVHAGGQAELPIACHGVRRHRHDPRPGGPASGADPAGRLEPSSSGIWTSISTRSNVAASSAAMASSPFSATSAAYPICRAAGERASGSPRCPRPAGSAAGVGRPGGQRSSVAARPPPDARTASVRTPWRASSSGGRLDRLRQPGNHVALPLTPALAFAHRRDRTTTGSLSGSVISARAVAKASPSKPGQEVSREARRRNVSHCEPSRSPPLPSSLPGPSFPTGAAGQSGSGGSSALSSTTSAALPVSSRDGRGAGPRRRVGVPRERRSAPEPAALARDAGAFRRDRAALQLGQAPADGKAQTGPAVSPGDRGVGLAERLEQAAHPVGRDADAGVADGDGDLPARASSGPWLDASSAPARDRHDHLAGLGELDRVRQEVEDDLAQPSRVADQGLRAGPGRSRRPARCPSRPRMVRPRRVRPRCMPPAERDAPPARSGRPRSSRSRGCR